MRATLTLAGLYNWDDTIFAGWTLPATVDSDTLHETLLLECGQLEITLPDPELFKRCTDAWSTRRGRAWARALAAMAATYNPIHNYDRTEQSTDADTGSTGTDSSSTGTTTETVAAFNSNSYDPKDRITANQTGETSTTYGRNHSHNSTVSGNIGVTTSQQMVEAELELSDKLDIYELITNDFKREFCLRIY